MSVSQVTGNGPFLNIAFKAVQEKHVDCDKITKKVI